MRPRTLPDAPPLRVNTPADRSRALRASARFEAVCDVLRPLMRSDDRIGRLAMDLESRAREMASDLRDAALLAEMGDRS